MVSQVVWQAVNEDASFRWGYSSGEIVAEWPGLVTIRATADGQLLELVPAPGAHEGFVEKARLGVVAAFLRARRRGRSLHASAVALEDRALLCIGASGAGKSTLAARMCARPGVALLGDDTTGVEAAPDGLLRVFPSENVTWLIAEEHGVKAPVTAPRVSENAVPVRCIISLVFDDATPRPVAGRLRGVDAVSAILPSVVRFEKGAAVWSDELDFLERLVSQSVVFEVRRARSVSAETVASALLDLLSSESS